MRRSVLPFVILSTAALVPACSGGAGSDGTGANTFGESGSESADGSGTDTTAGDGWRRRHGRV